LTRQTGQARNPAAARTQTDPAYEQLIQPDGPIIFAGDHCSHIVGWQEGAALSAHYAISKLTEKVKAARLVSPAIVAG
jgi:monoamine oxidase